MSMLGRAVAAILVGLIRFYQIAISPLIGPNCRFTPTCSQYAMEVIKKDGPLKGGVSVDPTHSEVPSLAPRWPRPALARLSR